MGRAPISATAASKLARSSERETRRYTRMSVQSGAGSQAPSPARARRCTSFPPRPPTSKPAPGALAPSRHRCQACICSGQIAISCTDGTPESGWLAFDSASRTKASPHDGHRPRSGSTNTSQSHQRSHAVPPCPLRAGNVRQLCPPPGALVFAALLRYEADERDVGEPSAEPDREHHDQAFGEGWIRPEDHHTPHVGDEEGGD